VQGGDVVEHQRRRAQPRMPGAGRRQQFPPPLGGVDRQTPLEGPVGHRLDAGLRQHAHRVQLGRRLDDPGQHQVPKHLILASSGEPDSFVGSAQGVPQVPHPRSHDRQRPTGLRRSVQANVELALTCRHALTGDGLEQFELDLIVRRPNVLDVPRTLARGVDNLHRTRPRGGPYRADVGHQTTLGTTI
jgi:hypothetical protein